MTAKHNLSIRQEYELNSREDISRIRNEWVNIFNNEVETSLKKYLAEEYRIFGSDNFESHLRLLLGDRIKRWHVIESPYHNVSRYYDREKCFMIVKWDLEDGWIKECWRIG